MNLISDKIIQALCWTLLHSLWQGLLMAFITGLVLVISKKSSAALRYNLLSVLLLFFLTAAGITFYIELHAYTSAASQHILAGTANFFQPGIQAGGVDAAAAYPLENFISRFSNYFDTHASLVVAIWFIVFMARCINILSGLVNVQRLMHYRTNAAPGFWSQRVSELAVQLQIKRVVLLLESAIIKVPVVIGFLKPTILVPVGMLANLSPDQVESILLHELAHIRRRDYMFNVVQRFVDILFFFNPAVLWISALIRNERENCCDDIAIAKTKSKKQFVQALVSFYEYNRTANAYAMQFAGRKNRLVNRVKRIANNNNQTLNPVEKMVLAATLVVFSVVCLSTRNSQQQKQASVQTPAGNPVLSAKQEKVTTDLKTGNAETQHKITAGTHQETRKATPSEKPASVPSNIVPQEQLTWLKPQDTETSFAQNFLQIGYTQITVAKLQELKDHGVDADFITAFYAIGYKDISPDKAIMLKDHGVTANFISRFVALGYKNISLDKATDLKDHGVSPFQITTFTKLGYRDISLELAQALQDHGVEPDFIQDFLALGYKEISLAKAIDLKDHGVNADFIKGFHDQGFADITLDKATQLKDHGVSTAFIALCKKKTGSDHTLDEYIDMKDQL